MIALLLAAALAAGPEGTSVATALTLQVPRPEEVADLLAASATRRGGWYASRTPDELRLRVPVDQVDALVEEAAGLGRVVARSLEKQDLRTALVGLEARIAARREVLDRYEEVLAHADAGSIVTVEQRIVAAITDLEPLLGEQRRLTDLARYGAVVVTFRHPDRRAPTSGESPFAWVRSLDLNGVIDGLADRRARGASPVAAAVPDGFATYRREDGVRAVSPDRVRFRIREVRRQPEATLAFWREAVRGRQEASGYRVLAEQALERPRPGALIELGASRGPEDWTYLVAFFPEGDRVVVVEAAGPADRVAARREAIVAAMTGWSPR